MDNYGTIQCPKCFNKIDLPLLVPTIVCPNCGEVIDITYPNGIFPKRKYNEDGCLEKKEDVDTNA
jgi:hypothetical protein